MLGVGPPASSTVSSAVYVLVFACVLQRDHMPAAASGAVEEKPLPLRALEEGRRAIRSGVVEWSVRVPSDPDNDRKYVSRFAKNGDMIFEDRGDSSGRTLHLLDERPGDFRLPQLFLRNSTGVWHHQETGLQAKWYAPNAVDQFLLRSYVQDPRMVGIVPSAHSMQMGIGFAALWEESTFSEMEWEQSREGDRHVIRGAAPSGATAIWEIDAGRGWNVERAEVVDAGGVKHEVRCTLRKYGQVWLPEKTEYFRAGELTKTIVIRSANLNQDSDPQEFTPLDLGLEPGMEVSGVDETRKPRPWSKWNGEAAVPAAEWYEDLKAGRRQWGPTMAEVIRTGKWDSPYLTDEDRAARDLAEMKLNQKVDIQRHEGLWARYVRDFIRRYELSDEQAQRAHSILADCQQRAKQLLRRDESKLTQIANALQNARSAGNPEQVKRQTELLDEALRPIDEIFENTLKPKLDKLPTREQRRKAEGRE